MVAEWHGHQQEAEGEAKIMASTYQRGEWYWGKVQRNGVPHRFPLRTKDPAIAETRLASRVKELDAPRGAIGGEWTVDEAADRFVDEHFPNLKPKAIRRYRASLRWLLPVFGHMKLADLSSKDLSAFETERRRGRTRDGRRISVVTVKRDLACLSSIFSSCEEWEWVSRNPVLPYIRGRAKKGVMVENEGRDRYLSHDEERLGMFHMPETIRDAYVVAIDTGLRAEEQWSLRKENVNRARRRVTVYAGDTKSTKSRTIPLSERAWEIIERRLMRNESEFIFWRWMKDPLDGEEGAERVEHTWAYREFQKGIAAAGLEDVEWHDLRRTCGCRLLQDKGFSLLQVSKWLGHSSVKVTEKHYAFLYVDDLEKQLAKSDSTSA
jgi:integrase/recombinase XerD